MAIKLELADWMRLHEHVRRVVRCINLLNKDLSFSNGFSDEVMLDINMLRSLMIHVVILYVIPQKRVF